MKRLLRPKVLIPTILSLALLGGLLAIADLKKVVGLMSRFQHVYLLYFLLLMLAYEIVRGVQWHVLLRGLGINIPLQTQAFTFAGGEVTKSLPIGNYFQNYLLQVSRDTDFGRSSSATTLIILTEVAVALCGVVILGLGSWVWVRPLIIGGTLVTAVIGWIAYLLYHRGVLTLPAWLQEHEGLRNVVAEFRQFRAGIADLSKPGLLFWSTLLGAMYLLIAGIGFYLIVRGLGITSVLVGQALAVYFFGLAAGLILPLPVDIGVTEISAAGAFMAVGLDRNAAIGVVLINRVLSIGSALAIALLVIAVLPGELRAVLRARSRDHHETQSLSSTPTTWDTR